MKNPQSTRKPHKQANNLLRNYRLPFCFAKSTISDENVPTSKIFVRIFTVIPFARNKPYTYISRSGWRANEFSRANNLLNSVQIVSTFLFSIVFVVAKNDAVNETKLDNWILGKYFLWVIWFVDWANWESFPVFKPKTFFYFYLKLKLCKRLQNKLNKYLKTSEK